MQPDIRMDPSWVLMTAEVPLEWDKMTRAVFEDEIRRRGQDPDCLSFTWSCDEPWDKPGVLVVKVAMPVEHKQRFDESLKERGIQLKEQKDIEEPKNEKP